MNKEKILVKKAKKDKDAFMQLYNTYYPKLFAYLLVRTKDRDLAEDILQETFLKSLKAIKKYEYKGKTFGSWLYKIAHNELVSYWRKDNRLTKTPSPEDFERIENAVNSAQDKMIEKEDFRYLKEQEQKLIIALDKLKLKDKELVTLKYFSKISYKDLSIIFNAKPTALAVRLHRILKQLKKLID